MTTWSEALIIGKQPFREHDKLFTVYTREHGKRTLLAQGTRKILSKLSGHLEVIHHVRILCAQGKVFDRITIVDPLCFHEYLKRDLEKLALVFFCFDVIAYCVKEHERDEELFFLITDFLSKLKHVTGTTCLHLTQVFLITFFIHLGHGIPSCSGSKEILHNISSRSFKNMPLGWYHSSCGHIVRLLLEEHTGIACKSKDFYFLLERKLSEKPIGSGLSWE